MNNKVDEIEARNIKASVSDQTDRGLSSPNGAPTIDSRVLVQ